MARDFGLLSELCGAIGSLIDFLRLMILFYREKALLAFLTRTDGSLTQCVR
jgi:hypothetical protein